MTSRSIRTPRRTAAVVGLAAVIGLLGSTPAMSAGEAPAAPAESDAAADAAVPADVTPLRVNTSLLGEHRWYRQVKDGYPVVGGLYAVHETTRGPSAGETSVWDGRVAVGALASTDATITSTAAVDAAVAYTDGVARTFVAPSLWVLPGSTAHLVWAVTTVTSDGVNESHVSYVDARTGQVLDSVVESKSESGPAAKYVTGKASVFDPNPVAKLQDQDLTDQDDSNDAVPAKAYSTRKLRHLDKSHTLVGRWAKIMNDDIASSPNDKYFFKRQAEDFEQVMGYYALDVEQSYYQSLGFKDINAEAQKIETNTFDGDNSFYSPSQDLITMGSGGVDDAEDPEVTWHEGGHATQDAQVPGFGSSPEAGAMGEGFGDYIAVTLSQQYAKDTKTTPWACVMDWDSVSYSGGPIHCLRRTDTDKHYPEDLEGQVHADGEIWSAALWDINQKLGRDKATTAVLEAQFSYSPSINMPGAAALTVKAAKDLYGSKVSAKVKQALEDRGIL